MTPRSLFTLLILLFGLIGTVPASATPLITDLSTHQVELRSTFTGTDILVFGATDDSAIPGGQFGTGGPKDIVVIIKGPNKKITVRRKDRLGPIWVNNESLDFNSVPAFIAVRSTRPLDDIADPVLLKRLEIGVDYLALPTTGDRPDDLTDWQQSIRRNMVRNGLYSENADDIRFIGKSLFRTSINIPANVPPGTYTAQIYLFQGGQVVTAQVTPLFIDKKGIERVVYITAKDYAWGYGILAVIIALLAGWGAAVIFGKT